MIEQIEFDIWDGDEYFASVCGCTREAVWREVIHYASQCNAPRIEEVVRTEVPMSEVASGAEGK